MSFPPHLLHTLKTLLQDLLFPLRMHFGRKIISSPQRQIVRISRHTLIKGPCSDQELEAMVYVSSHTTVSLPRVQRVYRQSRGRMYIAMDFIRGGRLDELWPDLDQKERRGAVGEVCEMLRKLHAIPVPRELGLAISSIEGGALHDGIFGPSPLGPFTSIQEFHDRLEGNPNVDQYREIWDSPQAEASRSVLSHADIAPRNLIRRDEDGELVLIDWEFSGWWPEYWERVKWHFTDFPETEGWVGMMDEGANT
ncbi:hypothetical protein LTR86_009023 [Recurvomyces mirabilis]|nr:hypothetical protein LTR86_009023 [Recurvomyces mirabilis]